MHKGTRKLPRAAFSRQQMVEPNSLCLWGRELIALTQRLAYLPNIAMNQNNRHSDVEGLKLIEPQRLELTQSGVFQQPVTLSLLLGEQRSGFTARRLKLRVLKPVLWKWGGPAPIPAQNAQYSVV